MDNSGRLVTLKVHPASKRGAIEKKKGDAYEVWVKAPAERGLATAEALARLADFLGVERKKVVLIKGAASPAKIAKVYG